LNTTDEYNKPNLNADYKIPYKTEI